MSMQRAQTGDYIWLCYNGGDNKKTGTLGNVELVEYVQGRTMGDYNEENYFNEAKIL